MCELVFNMKNGYFSDNFWLNKNYEMTKVASAIAVFYNCLYAYFQ